MSFYPSKINDHFENPSNTGFIDDANAVGKSATFVCGAVLRFTLRIDQTTKEIMKAKFQTNGCGYLIASADVLADKIVGKFLTELHGLEILQSEVENELGSFNEHRKHCLELTLETLNAAFNDFRATQIEEWTGEKALICNCFGVSEETIEQNITAQNLETVEEVTNVCKAGGGCGSCQPLIQEILDNAFHEGF